MRFLAVILAAFAALVSLPAAAQDYPARPDGPILDAANILPDAEEAALDQKLRAYNEETGRAIIVATVPSLDGETVERYAVELYEKWGIGGTETDMGALLLVAPDERKVRIEVGYGLTPYLTDVMSGRIIRNEIIPHFKQNDYAGGIVAGVNGILETLSMDPADAKAIAEAEAAREASRKSDGASVGGVIFWIFMIVVFMSIFGRGGRRRRRYGAASAVGDVLLWSAIGSAMGDRSHHSGGWGSGGGGGFSGGGGFGGFGGGMSGGGGASGSW